MDGNDIVKKRFARAFRGYDIQEVDSFLDEVILELDQRDREKEEYLATIEKLLSKLDEKNQASPGQNETD